MYRERAAATHTERKGRAEKGAEKVTKWDFSPFFAHSHALRENVDLACLTSVCDAEQLYTDAVFVLDASPRVAAASGSGAIDLHFMHKHSRLFNVLCAHLMLVRCCEDVDLASASRRSVTLSSYTQTQCSC